MTGVGPELARALGGEWDARGTIALNAEWAQSVYATWGGAVWLISNDGDHYRVGSLSDGADTLAARARELGAGT